MSWHDLFDLWQYGRLPGPIRNRTMDDMSTAVGAAKASSLTSIVKRRPSTDQSYEDLRVVKNAVTEISPATPEEALAYFAAEFAFQTDCWDVHEAMRSGDPGFVLLDVRGPAAFAQGHVPGAINIPHAKIIGSRMAEYPAKYCSSCTARALTATELHEPQYGSHNSVGP